MRWQLQLRWKGQVPTAYLLNQRILGGIGFCGSALVVGQANPQFTLIALDRVSQHLGRPIAAHLHPDTHNARSRLIPSATQTDKRSFLDRTLHVSH
jgi:hypothetical protein